MYNLPHFTEKDPEKVMEFMKENSFANIIGFDGSFPVATHIPLEIEKNEDGKLILRGHMMRKTDHHLAFEKNNSVLVIFNGPHCYISASWYSNTQSASTWNFMTVHAKGKMFFTDEEGTYQAIKDITDKYEGTETAAAFNNLSKEMITPMMKAIVGFTIEIADLQNVFKLSQNRNVNSQHTIISELMKKGDHNSVAIANEMKNRL